MTTLIFSIACATFSMIFNTGAIAANIGTPLSLKTVSGSPSFSAIYTYGNDPDGSQYLLNFSTLSTDSRPLHYNFYLAVSDTFLMPWSSAFKMQM